MRLNKTIILPIINDIRQEAVRVIIQQMGIAKAAFYFRENYAQPMDWINHKDMQFGEKSATDIYEEMASS